jgi:hypothetical protein
MIGVVKWTLGHVVLVKLTILSIGFFVFNFVSVFLSELKDVGTYKSIDNWANLAILIPRALLELCFFYWILLSLIRMCHFHHSLILLIPFFRRVKSISFLFYVVEFISFMIFISILLFEISIYMIRYNPAINFKKARIKT